jgi:hypothetical protein
MISLNLFALIAVGVVIVGSYLWIAPRRRKSKTAARQVGMNSGH